jgi:hypothetical protein
MWSDGKDVGIAGTRKNPKVGVRGSGVPKRTKWGEGVVITLVGRRCGRWQRGGSQLNNELEGKPGIALVVQIMCSTLPL